MHFTDESSKSSIDVAALKPAAENQWLPIELMLLTTLGNGRSDHFKSTNTSKSRKKEE